jgi:ketosteroid isomerase-like protein
MKRNYFFSLVMFITLTSANAFGQTWSAQQKEVWTNVETYWSVQAKGDVEGFLSYFSQDYMGWDYGSPVPQGKTSTAKYITMNMKNSKMLFYDITPVAILVYGDIAIVDYYYSLQTENAEAKKQWKTGRWTDILQKQGGGAGTKWVLIADHGGEDKDKK